MYVIAPMRQSSTRPLLPLAFLFALGLPAGCDQPGMSPSRNRPWGLPLNNPSMVTVDEATHMRPDDMVAGLVVRGQARAYPWWIMRNYHLVNDTVPTPEERNEDAPIDDWTPYVRQLQRPDLPGDPYIPLLITLCEACSGSSAFIPAVDDTLNRPMVFQPCQRVRKWNGDFAAAGVYTICDTRTHSRCHPFSGRAGSGALKGARLPRVPVVIEYWKTWTKLHPNTLVVLGSERLRHRQHATLPHGGTMGNDAEHPSFTRVVRENPELEDTRLDRNQLVLGVANPDGAAIAYPLEDLRTAGGFVEQDIDGEPYLLMLNGSYRGLAYHRRLDGEILHFRVTSTDPIRFEDNSGTVWGEHGEAMSGPRAGRRLTPAPDSYQAEWADWSLEHPGTVILPRTDRHG